MMNIEVMQHSFDVHIPCSLFVIRYYQGISNKERLRISNKEYRMTNVEVGNIPSTFSVPCSKFIIQTECLLFPHCPRQSIWYFTHINVRSNFQSFKIYDRDIIIWGTRYECS